MMREDRKAAIAAYKERKVAAGLYAVRCAPTGEQWIGRAGDLSTIRNRVWFALRLGNHAQRAMQAAWNAHGADAFDLVELERFEEEEPDYVRDARAKERMAFWRKELNAGSI
jgi:hypothetical protein